MAFTRCAFPLHIKVFACNGCVPLAAPGGLATFAGMDDDQPTAEAARRKLATVMIDKLVNRLPGHTRTQRLALLQQAFSEMRHRCFTQPDPVELDAAGKPTPASWRARHIGGVPRATVVPLPQRGVRMWSYLTRATRALLRRRQCLSRSRTFDA